MILNCDLEFMKTVNITTHQPDFVTGCHGDGVLGNTAIDICVLTTDIDLTMHFVYPDFVYPDKDEYSLRALCLTEMVP